VTRPGRRVLCLVPFCTCTRGDRKGDPLPADLTFYEWICPRHWSALPTMYRRAYRRACRRYSASYGAADAARGFPDKASWLKALHDRSAAQRLWRRLKRLAIERAAGIG
jgi:hypothetical protein